MEKNKLWGRKFTDLFDVAPDAEAPTAGQVLVVGDDRVSIDFAEAGAGGTPGPSRFYRYTSSHVSASNGWRVCLERIS